MSTVQSKKKSKLSLGKVLGRIFLTLLITIILVAVLLLGVIFIMEQGPSKAAKELFVRSVNETSALKFVAGIFLPENETTAILSQTTSNYDAEIERSLLELVGSEESSESEDIWVTKDTDNDGIIVEKVVGNTFSGYMMIVKDPMRVMLAIDEDHYGYKSHYVDEYCEMYEAIAGINGGGFADENGQGNGAESDSLVVYCGDFFSNYYGTKNGFVGIDDKGVLHVDCQTSAEIEDANIMFGCAYGPILVKDGKIVDNLISDWSGLNPRTAIGQKEDGSILLLVIDGRHVDSLGAQYSDLANVMLDYGAVNAGNMDGGSSTAMYFNGERLNNKAAVLGARPCPNAWVVLPEGDSSTNVIKEMRPDAK